MHCRIHQFTSHYPHSQQQQLFKKVYLSSNLINFIYPAGTILLTVQQPLLPSS